MAHEIVSVEAGSIASQLGLVPGDTLLSVNGEPVLDQIDYQYLTAREALTLEVGTARGIVEYQLEKDAEEPLGIIFASTLMSKPRTCANHCVFCFIDQMPPGLRDTLYVKDDDWRLSLMMGNYITLTNLSEKEFERIIARKASPLFISVHATDSAVRARIMGNPRATKLIEQLHRLQDAGISFHCQIVLCPGINDGAILDDTLATLATFYPAARSAALVPVGLTCHREGLANLTPYNRRSAGELLAQAAKWQKRFLKETGTRFVFPADEFYCLADAPLPPDEAYEGYPQIENGVGLLRNFEKEFSSAYAYMDPEETRPRRVVIATGTSVTPFLRTLLAKNPMPGVDITVIPVPNHFFGTTVTVAGLLTGGDLRTALEGIDTDEILIAEAMLRHEGSLFLDDTSRDALEAALGIPVHVAGSDGAEFCYALQGELYQQ